MCLAPLFYGPRKLVMKTNHCRPVLNTQLHAMQNTHSVPIQPVTVPDRRRRLRPRYTSREPSSPEV